MHTSTVSMVAGGGLLLQGVSKNSASVSLSSDCAHDG
jgi:hypothetical protein